MTETLPGEIIIGIDTHKHPHAAVVINTLGARLGTMTIPVSRTGYRDLEAWAESFGPIRAFGVEGTGSYGAALTRSLQATATPSSRSVVPIASCAISRVRATRSTPKAPLVPCWPARPRLCRSPGPVPSRSSAPQDRT